MHYITNDALYDDGALIYVKSRSPTYYVCSNTTVIKPHAFKFCRDDIKTIIFCGGKIEKFEGRAFANCHNLTSLNTENLHNLKSIGTRCFSNCTSLTTLIIPSSVTTIFKRAFSGCTKLGSIKFLKDSQLRQLGEKVFCDSGLKAFTIPDNLKSFYASAFFARPLRFINISANNHNFYVEDDVIFSKTKTMLLYFPYLKKLDEYVVSNGVRILEMHSMSCKALKRLVLPPSLELIHTYAFIDSFIEIINFSQCNNLRLIGSRAFSGSRIQFLNVSHCLNLKMIDDCVFEYCNFLKYVELPPSIESIKQKSFFNCTRLLTISLNSNISKLSYIGKYAFYGTGIRNFTLGPNVSYFSGKTFLNCHNLATVSVDNRSVNFSSLNNVIFNKNLTKLIYYPTGLKNESYKIPSSVKSIRRFAFAANKYITEVILPSKLRKICQNAFSRSAIHRISTPNNLRMIHKSAFKDCKNLTVATINGSFTQLPEKCFKGDVNLTIINLPNSYESSPRSAFENCTEIKCITYPKEMKQQAFFSGLPWGAMHHENCSAFEDFVKEKHRNYSIWHSDVLRPKKKK
ncbi:surface antigen BspA-like [Trichomonas vaginalis G3]|uniref:Surface antigen BspA-like n=1 Tax=Trichomonas vaginalis (strain ATCC PRA-98 / G3) TaxID=412133 RepID=A2EXX2_TRIV3|nr:ribonuclease inhibitor domain-containing protein [Trichomonas vaginalis G3]EAY02505.1 surface antigen BspA-like [Trichomonas vaginalis G3]KAI5529081.1 ribonuclease inhibitor domain-containing protein [Trichomonas vaginalis G3]|eukprot:XP_001314744.1 surface antigen BspA-like [Trichomonas vaginalis G3]